MSERDPGLGSFVLGIAVGVTLGLLLAPEAGTAFRGKVARRLRALRGLAAGTAGDLGTLVLDVVSSEADDLGPASRRSRSARRRRAGEEDASPE